MWHAGARARATLTDWIAKREDSERLRGEAGIESLSQEAMALLGVPAAATRARECEIDPGATLDSVRDVARGAAPAHPLAEVP